MDRYEKMTDEQLIQKLRDGDNRIVDYIMEKYKNLVRKEANAMYLLGGENEDLIQEGMIPDSFTPQSRLPGERNTVR